MELLTLEGFRRCVNVVFGDKFSGELDSGV